MRRRAILVVGIALLAITLVTAVPSVAAESPPAESAPASYAEQLQGAQNPQDVIKALQGVPPGVTQNAQQAPFTAPVTGQLTVYTTPDPTVADSGAYIYAPMSLASAPTVTVIAPDGSTQTSAAQFSYGQWWTAALNGGAPGVYRVVVQATPADGSAPQTATSAFEVVAEGPQTPAASRWQPVGPHSMGGLLALDPHDAKTFYLSSDIAAALWVSHDGAQTWREDRTLPVAAGYPTALVADPSARGRLYLSINGSNGFAVADPTYTGKILRSDDGGTSWRALALPDVFVSGMAVDASGGTIAAVTSSGVYISHDGGASWTQLDTPWNWRDYDGLTLVGSTLYVATFDGLFALRDITTQPQAPVPVFVPQGRSAWVTAVAGDASALYANSWANGIFVSHDGGATWSHVFTPSGFVFMLSDVNGTVYTNVYDTIWVSRDQGQSWQAWPDPVPESIDVGVAASGGTTYVVEDDAGIYATTNYGQSYTRVGVPGVDVNALGVVTLSSGARLVAGTRWGAYSTPLGGPEAVNAQTFNWDSAGQEGLLNASITQMATGGGAVYRTARGFFGSFSIQKSTDAGLTWSAVYQGRANPSSVYVDPADPNVVLVATSGFQGGTLIASTDGGQTWTSTHTPAAFQALAMDPANPQRIWGGSSSGLYVSNDGGANFAQLQSVAVSALAVLPSGQLVMGGSQVFTSADGGVTIQPVSYPGPGLDISVRALLVSPADANVVYAALGSFYEAGLRKGGRGVWRSADGGRTWAPLDDGLDNLDATSLAATPDGRHLYVGTDAGGVFRIKLPAIG